MQFMYICDQFIILLTYRPPPPHIADSQPSSFSLSRQSTNQSGDYVTGDTPIDYDIQTNPEMPSPVRVRWKEAFNRVCEHLSTVSAKYDK